MMTNSLQSKRLRLILTGVAIAMGAALAVASRAVAQQQNFDAVQMDLVQVRPNVYMIVGPRQVPEARVAMAQNAGGWIGSDAAACAIHILKT